MKEHGMEEQQRQSEKPTEVFIKAKDEADFHASMVAAGLARATPLGIVFDGVEIDIIGSVMRSDGKGGIEQVPGFHANLFLRANLTMEQSAKLPIIPKPKTPVRTWSIRD